ncbi:hypothetical protein FGB62_13g246 [Gracilaria domingensis]|nr:hypothetical protein FGB62_13g246 [Gracilaria domingensis]
MVATANSVRAQREQVEQNGAEQQQQYKPPPLNWWRRLHREIVCGGIRTAVMTVAFVYLGLYTYLQITESRRKWKAAQDDDDVLLKLDQDEFERRTKPDPGTDGSVILSSEPEPQEEEELKDEEKEFFGSEQADAVDRQAVKGEPVQGEPVQSEPVQTNTPQVKGVGPLYENQASDKHGNTKPGETKGGDVHVDWDNLQDGEKTYTQSYTLDNKHKWKHLLPKDDD